MHVLYPRCCGLAMHQKPVVACVLRTQTDGTLQRLVRTCGTMPTELVALGEWVTG
jgi:transposase